MKSYERLLKALANRRRLAILRYLQKEREARVTEIARTIKLSFKATSRHLQQLASVDILEREQRSVDVFYRIGRNLPPPGRAILAHIPNSSE